MEVRHSLNEKGKHLVVVNNAKFCQVRMLSENSIRFNPHMWGTSTTETTSVCERFHSHFKSNFYGIHPTIYIFVNKIVSSLISVFIILVIQHESGKTSQSYKTETKE
jgi:hypothetical protein